MSLLPSGLEDHPTGTLNKNAVLQGNWTLLDALLSQGAITYADPLPCSMLARIAVATLTGDPAITFADKLAGRKLAVVLTASGADRTPTWPAGSTWAGPTLTTIPSGTTVVVDVLSTSTADAGLILSIGGVAFTAGTGLTLTAGQFAIDSTVATLTGTQTLTNKTLTSPKINAVLDTAGNPAVTYTATGIAVNGLTFTNAATGTGPTISASGSDTDIDLTLTGKGAGGLILTVKTIKRNAASYTHVTASRAVTDADNGKTLYNDGSSDYVLTFPDTLTLPFACELESEGTGLLTIAASGAATVNNVDGHTGTSGQYAAASVTCRTGSIFTLRGQTA